MPTLDRQKLCTTFETLAQWTHAAIARGYATGLGILEESITDFALNEIASQHSEFIYTKKFSRKQEGCESGADWLWCIGGPGAWLPISVQAKIVNPATKRCHYLDYATQRGKQRSIFLKYARTHALFPTYCIYGLIEANTYPEAMKIKSLSRSRPNDWACSFISPKYVRQLVHQDRRTQSDLLTYGFPWAYPFCESARMPGLDLASAVAKSFLKVRKDFIERENGGARTKGNKSQSLALARPIATKAVERNQWEDIDPTRLVTTDIPSLVIRLLKSRVRYDDAPFSMVTVVSSVPVEAVLNGFNALPAPNEDLPVFAGMRERERIFWRPR